MKLSTKIIAAVIVVAGSTGVVYAASKYHHWDMTPGEKIELVTNRVTNKLDLDPQQQQNFRQLADAVAQILIDAKASRAEELTEIGELLQQSNLNQIRLLELVQRKTQLVNTHAPTVISSLAVFVDSLDAAQKQQLQTFIQRRHRHARHSEEL